MVNTLQVSEFNLNTNYRVQVTDGVVLCCFENYAKFKLKNIPLNCLRKKVGKNRFFHASQQITNNYRVGHN